MLKLTLVFNLTLVFTLTLVFLLVLDPRHAGYRHELLNNELARFPNIAGKWFHNRWGMDVLLLYVPETRLVNYWDLDHVKGQYKGAFTPPSEPIEVFLEDLANERMPYKLIGLLFGYPVEETLQLLE